MLSFEISNQMVEDLKEINLIASEKASFLKTLSAEEKEAIHRYAKISTLGSTTRIENALLTDVEIDWMDETLNRDGHPTAFLKEKQFIENKLSKDKERSIEEVAGAREMIHIIYEQAPDFSPLTETVVKGLHNQLLQFYPRAEPYSGRYKIASNSVVQIVIGTDIRKTVLKTADPGPITDSAMGELIGWYNKTLSEYPWPIAVAAEFVFRFLAIHPFQDGNGRVGRGLFLLSLLQSKDVCLKEVIPYIALDRHIESNKEQYYLALRQCSGGCFSQDPKNYQIHFFLNFLLKMLKQSINHDIDFYFQKHKRYQKLPDGPRTIYHCFKEYPEKKLGLKDLMELIDMPRQTILYGLKRLVAENFLQKLGRQPQTKYQLTF